jgi:hypothetical protein
VQQGVRRHLMAVAAPLDLHELCGQVRDAPHTALGLGQQALEKGAWKSISRAWGHPKLPGGIGVRSRSV